MANYAGSLLKRALVHIPYYGFTLDAIKTASGGATEHGRTLQALFPGPDYKPTSAPRRLFGVWDTCARENTIVRGEGTPQSRDEAYIMALGMLERRLDVSADVQTHLLPVRLC